MVPAPGPESLRSRRPCGRLHARGGCLRVSSRSILSDMSRTPSARDLERRLRACTAEYEALKARIAEIGFICTGSLVKRWMVCGKSNCRCRKDPKQRHGPYYQLTWKEDGTTVSRRLPAEHALLYEQWIANRQQLDSLLSQMHRVSAKAARQLLRSRSDPSMPTEDPPLRARARNRR
jgi:transcriptional regulator with GAF, ATPase, and Fis domain